MLINDLQTLGFLFEALFERDMKIYAEAFGASLYHYQDYEGKEIDAVIELGDGECVIGRPEAARVYGRRYRG